MRDVKRMRTEPPEGTMLDDDPINNNIMSWNAVLYGPEGMLWDGLCARVHFEFTEEYPNKAPTVSFQTSSAWINPRVTVVDFFVPSDGRTCACTVFHPNIYKDGTICLDILQNQWSPMYDMSAILSSLQSLLCDPNPASPANPEAATLYEKQAKAIERGGSRAECTVYDKKVRECVEASWATHLPPLPPDAAEEAELERLGGDAALPVWVPDDDDD